MRVLNFYSSVFADQLRRGRKTATIRLGDKSHKYHKNECVLVTIGYQHSPREKIFNAVIDQAEVKRVQELSPRDIEHDNPEFRRVDEMVHFLEQIYGRKVSMDDTVTVVRFSQIIENPPDQMRDRIHTCGAARNYLNRLSGPPRWRRPSSHDEEGDLAAQPLSGAARADDVRGPVPRRNGGSRHRPCPAAAG